MRLTVLGGSAAGPNTGQGCSGYLADTGRTRIVLDLGPGTLPELRRHADFRRLDAVVVSHLHLDHVLDLLALRFALAYNPRRPPRRLSLWLPPGGRMFLERVAVAFAAANAAPEFFSGVYDAAEYDPAAPLAIGDAELRFTPTAHYVPCWAIRVQGGVGGQSFAYTADTGPIADLARFARGVDVVIAEAGAPATLDEPESQRGHLTAREAGQLATETGAATLVLSHLWEEYGFETYRAEARSAYSGRLELAHPGLQVEW